jgi:hypothetical protein
LLLSARSEHPTPVEHKAYRLRCRMSVFGGKADIRFGSSCVRSKSNKGGEATANVEAGALKELARTRRRNADKVDPGIGRTRLGHRTLKCALTIGTRSAQSIMASGLTAAQTGRTHDRTRPMLQQRQKVLAKAPSTHDP